LFIAEVIDHIGEYFNIKLQSIFSPLVTNLDRYIDGDNNEYIIETRYITKGLKNKYYTVILFILFNIYQ